MGILIKGWNMHRVIAHALLLLMLWLGGAAYAGTVTYVYTDAQGTPLAEADASGNITARFDYTPYGVSVPSVGPAPNGPGYTGHVNDPDTGLVYMQARYYDPAVGRFLSVDPVSPAPNDLFNFNRYAYADNTPATRIDPDGRANVLGIVAQFPKDFGHPSQSDLKIQATAQRSVDLTVNAVENGGSAELRANAAKWSVEVDPRMIATPTGGTARTYGDAVHTQYTAAVGLLTEGNTWHLSGGVTAKSGDPALFVVGAHELAHATSENIIMLAGPPKEFNASKQAMELLGSSPDIKPNTVTQHIVDSRR